MSESAGEQPAAPHPTEGLPDYERQRHDAIQAEYERHNKAVADEDEQHAKNMDGINAHYAEAAESDTALSGGTSVDETA